MAARRAGAVVIVLDPLFIQHVPELAALATSHRLPSVFANREFADAGGLASYGWSQRDIYQRAAGYVDRILKGASPASLPVEQPQVFELVINARTARSLDLTIPASLVSTADEVLR
jgi:putative ABC transport system substrate-binding protein